MILPPLMIPGCIVEAARARSWLRINSTPLEGSAFILMSGSALNSLCLLLSKEVAKKVREKAIMKER